MISDTMLERMLSDPHDAAEPAQSGPAWRRVHKHREKLSHEHNISKMLSFEMNVNEL